MLEPPNQENAPLAAPTTKEADIALHRTDAKSIYMENILKANCEMRHKRNKVFRSEDGRMWRFNNKRGRVLEMLASDAGGVTQWDTLPWHTRLGASIHAMREAGLDIDTEREGEYRHARYRLLTPGKLVSGGCTNE